MKVLFEVALSPKTPGGRNSARSLVEELKAAIEDGRLARGTRLPATRDARAYFGVSRNTLADVYEKLSAEGYVIAFGRSGTFVADHIDIELPLPKPDATPAYRPNAFWLQRDVQEAINFWREPVPAASKQTNAIAEFRPGIIDQRLFPFEIFRRLMAKQLRKLERKPSRNKSPQGNQGSYALRKAITDHIRVARAVVCEADDVLVTSGAQQAFDVLARALVRPGETVVAVEDPGYPPMRIPFAAAGARVVPVNVDREGLIVERLPQDAKIICVCPSHQYPLGVPMSEARRLALIDFAHRHEAIIVEDDYDGEFRYDGHPLQALHMRDAAERVFYVGTFSKCMLPSLRLGFLVARRWAMPTLTAVKNCTDWHTSLPVQLSVAAFIADGHLSRHVRKMRRVYKERSDFLVQTLRRDFADWLEPLPSRHGLHIGALAKNGVDVDAIETLLGERGVTLQSFGRFSIQRDVPPGFVFGYGDARVAEIRKGLSALHAVKEQLPR